MDYLDIELMQHQDDQDATCEGCGGCLIDQYYDCSCEEEEEILGI